MDVRSVDLSQFLMPDGYQTLLAGCIEEFKDDDRVVALLIVGSVGRGEADKSSDLDLLVVSKDTAASKDLLDHWTDIVDRITPTVYRRLLHGIIVNLVTPTWERLDLAFIDSDSIGLLSSGPAVTLFSRTPIDQPGVPQSVTLNGDDLVGRVEEFLRSVGLIVTGLERNEHTILTWATEFLIQELVDLMFLERGLTRRGPKRIYIDLPEQDRQVLENLPRPSIEPNSIIQAHLAVVREYLPRARRLIEQSGAEWPAALEASTSQYLANHLGVALA